MISFSLGFNPASLSRSATAGPTQAQVNAQVQNGAGSSFGRDSVARTSQRRDALKAVGHGVSTRAMLNRAGLAKVGAAKRGR